MRSLVRFSVDGERDGALRNRLAKVLTDAGYRLNPHVTATFEIGDISPVLHASTMQAFWTAAATASGPGHLDHVWMYSDNPPPPRK